MRVLLRRMAVLLIIGAGGAAVVKVLRGRHAAPAPTASTDWPPFEPRAKPVQGVAEPVTAPEPEPVIAPEPEPVAAPEPVAESSAAWVAPVDGGCPDGYPIKANNNSHIFHVPGGRFYVRTVAERCYATAEAAERDGYRRAKA